VCTGNTENWVDSYGDGCDWYEQNDLPGCEETSTLYQGEMGSASDHCCYCISNREDGIITNVESTLNDLADLIASIGNDEEISIESVQSAIGDLSELVFGNDKMSLAISEEGVPEEADTLFDR
jgi:hypothetical protein